MQNFHDFEDDDWEENNRKPSYKMLQNDKIQQLKVVGSTGSSYRVVEPNVESFNQRRAQQRQSKRDKRNIEYEAEPTNPVLRYKLGPPVSMNARELDQQGNGELRGCIANCDVIPTGKKSSRSVQYPDPSPILYELYQKSFTDSKVFDMKMYSD